jgi:hypothetical protein
MLSLRSLRAAPIAAFLVLLCARPTQARQDFSQPVLLCEEAVARLKSCCTDTQSLDLGTIHCEYGRDGCVDNPVFLEPDLRADESECILATSCDAIVANGVCERAQKAGSEGDQYRCDAGAMGCTAPQVCP